MKKPKMILFDYGHTIVHETDMDVRKGYEALLKFAMHGNFSPEEVYTQAEKTFAVLKPLVIEKGLELRFREFHKGLFESLDIKFDLPQDEMENIFWDALAPGKPMNGIEYVLNILKEKNIRSGVISNISFSETALRRRINTLIPSNNFEFFLASSDYIFRKPHPIMFEAALKKAALPAEDVWYCGDNPKADIEGASAAGITPIWFCPPVECLYNNEIFSNPSCGYIKITAWKELASIITEAECG